MTDRKILKLTAENFMRLKAVSISPSGDIVYITGANGEGKSSILNAICAALNWRDVSGQIPEPIHQGEKKATVSLDLGDMIVTRTWTPSGSQLKVESKDGAVYKSPQAMLDKFFSQVGFDPLEFIRMQPRDQRQALMDLLGIDFSEYDFQKSELLREKNQISSKQKLIEMQISELSTVPEGTPDEEISATGLIQQIKTASSQESEKESILNAILLNNKVIEEKRERISSLQRQLEELYISQEEMEKSLAEIHPEPIAPLQEKLSSIESINQNVRIKKQRNDLSIRLKDIEADLDCIIEQIQDIDQDKKDTLESAKFPVKGLSFDETGVLFNGFSLKQASSAEQIRVSVAIGISMNPSLKVLLIRDGSLLDSKSREIIADMASKHGMQVWIEAVDETGSMGFVISDGQVSSTVEPGQQVLA